MFTMQFFIKLILSNIIIITCSIIGRKMPTLGGLLVTMPITSLIVLLWIYSESPDKKIMLDYSKGALWGIAPTILFFIAAYFCFSRGYSIWLVLGISFACWLIGAAVHQWLL